jgi:hypothetical protein
MPYLDAAGNELPVNHFQRIEAGARWREDGQNGYRGWQRGQIYQFDGHNWLLEFAPVAPAPEAAMQPGVAQQPGMYYNVDLIRQMQDQLLQQAQWNAQPVFQERVPREVPELPEEEDKMPPKAQLINSYKIGSDPEFICLGAKGELQEVTALLAPYGRVGYDHNGRIAEIRPSASRCALTHTRNIAELLNGEGAKPIRNYRWKAGGFFKGDYNRESLGGHIHFDLPFAESAKYVPALDRLTQQLEDCDVLPRTECAERRKHGQNYGRFGDIRPAGRGKVQRLEYRTPASWLFDPKTALYCLTTYKLAAAEPAVALDMLSKEGSAGELRKFLETFRGKDDDADFVLEKFLEKGGLRTIKGNPDADVRAAWERLPF